MAEKHVKNFPIATECACGRRPGGYYIEAVADHGRGG
jgi:hypothetical protein